MLIASLATVGILGTACGEDTADTSSTSGDTSAAAGTEGASPDGGSPADTFPACSDVWVADADLPKRYDGCNLDGSVVEPEVVECSSGQRLVIFDDQYWALRGHVIKHAPEGLAESKAYADVLYSCRA